MTSMVLKTVFMLFSLLVKFGDTFFKQPSSKLMPKLEGQFDPQKVVFMLFLR